MKFYSSDDSDPLNIKPLIVETEKINFKLPKDLDRKYEYSKFVIAEDNNKYVGVWFFNYHDDIIHSILTYISKKYRKMGLAKKLWSIGIKNYKPSRIEVTSISDRGLTLVNSLMIKYPYLAWDIDENADRKLRVLKKRLNEKMV